MVNTVTVYGGEIVTFTENYALTLNQKTIASMMYCVMAICGSLIIGSLLDKYKAFKSLSNVVAATIGLCIAGTAALLQFGVESWLTVAFIGFTGMPMGGVSVVAY